MKEDENNGMFHDENHQDYIDKSVEFEAHIAPLLSQFMNACRKYGMPALLMVNYSHARVSDGDGFGMAGGVAGSMHHMPIPMLVAAGFLEDQVRDVLNDARRTFIGINISGDIDVSDDARTASMWRQAVAAQILDNGDPNIADRDLHKRVKIVMDAFEGIAKITPETRMDIDGDLDIERD